MVEASGIPAGPPARWLVGHLPYFARDRVGFLARCAAEYGEVVPLRIGKPALLLTNPDDLRHILITNASNYVKTPRLHSRKGRRNLGDNLLTSSGPDHQKRRRLLTPLFHNILNDTFAGVIVSQVRQMTADWKPGDVIDIAAAMRQLTQTVMIRMLFGDDGLINTDELAAAITQRRAYYAHVLGSIFPFPELIPSRVMLGYAQSMRRIQRTISHAIRVRRAAPDRAPDVISSYIHARHIDGTMLNDDQIRSEAITFIDAGYETISAALTWAWYLVAQHPQVQERLRTDSHAALGASDPVAGDVPKLEYAAMVLAEALRLYPPSWMFVRIPLGEDVLPSGVHVSPSIKLYLCSYAAHRNPHYFPEPQRFDPARFTAAAIASRPRLSYFPFGAGPHSCIGEAFARFEGTIVLATLARRFNFSLASDGKVKMSDGIVLKPAGALLIRLGTAG
jgi:cytochrome P450